MPDNQHPDQRLGISARAIGRVILWLHRHGHEVQTTDPKVVSSAEWEKFRTDRKRWPHG